MAEHGAHLTSGGPNDTNRPSVFEVLAQESLMSTVRPALRHAVRVFAEKYPDQLGRLIQHFDEIFLIFDTLVQSYYLKKYGGSFAENFYDLKRVPSGSPHQSLSPKLRYLSVACLVLIPYLRQKLDSHFEELRYKAGTGRDVSFSQLLSQKNLSRKQQMVQLYLSVYPYFHSAWECLTLVYTLTYMLRRGRWHSPSLHLSGTELRRLGPDDIFSEREKLHSPAWSDLGLRAKVSYLAKVSLNTAAACLSTSLSVGVFFLQFLDWWYASDSSAPSLTALPIPNPPQVIIFSWCFALTIGLDSFSQFIRQIYRYVFCYPCIAEHLRKERCCPVTGYPATSEHLVKIYEQDL